MTSEQTVLHMATKQTSHRYQNSGTLHEAACASSGAPVGTVFSGLQYVSGLMFLETCLAHCGLCHTNLNSHTEHEGMSGTGDAQELTSK